MYKYQMFRRQDDVTHLFWSYWNTPVQLRWWKVGPLRWFVEIKRRSFKISLGLLVIEILWPKWLREKIK